MASTDIIKNGYIFSDKVKVFPCAYRGETDNGEKIDPESRINTENNFRKLRGVLTKDSYIISSKTEIAETQIIKCILGGYYFEIDISSVFSDVIGTTARYNCLNIKTAAYTGTESEEVLDNSPVLIPFENGTAGNILDEKDEENFYYFKALKFSAQKESDSQYYLDVNSDASYFVVTYKEVESAIIGTHITGSLVEGTVPTAIAQMYDNSGLKNEAIGKASFAIGTDTHAKAENTIAGGKESWATSRNSVALGNNTQATADAAFSMGSGTLAAGTYSTAFGQGTKANGQDSIALGQETYANGVRSFSEGHNTVASGANSHAGGNQTKATAENTLAFGVGTTADQINMTALGIKNAPAKDGDLLVVGNALTINDDASTILEVNRNYVNIFDKPLSIKYADPSAPPYFCTKIGPMSGIQTPKISIGEQTTDAITLTGSNGNITASSLTLRNGANVAGRLTVNGITSSGGISTDGQLTANSASITNSLSAGSIGVNNGNVTISGTTNGVILSATEANYKIRPLYQVTVGVSFTCTQYSTPNEAKFNFQILTTTLSPNITVSKLIAYIKNASLFDNVNNKLLCYLPVDGIALGQHVYGLGIVSQAGLEYWYALAYSKYTQGSTQYDQQSLVMLPAPATSAITLQYPPSAMPIYGTV